MNFRYLFIVNAGDGKCMSLHNKENQVGKVALPTWRSSLAWQIKIFNFSTHIFRQENCAADWLVKHGLSLHSIVVWNEVPHRGLLCISTRIIQEEPLREGLPKLYSYLSYKKENKNKNFRLSKSQYVNVHRICLFYVIYLDLNL